MSTTVVGVDAGLADCSALEHLLEHAQDHTGPAALVCTHLVDGRWVGSLETSGPTPGAASLSDALGAAVTVLPADGPATTAGPSAWQDGSRRAATELRDRSAGRAVRFPGQELLVGSVPVDVVSATTAIEEVVGIAGTPTAGAVLVTRDFVRPTWRDGHLVLVVRPFADEHTLAPFEVPNPTPCCASHA